MPLFTRLLTLLSGLTLLGGLASAQTRQPQQRQFVVEHVTEVADPKLDGGHAELSIRLASGLAPVDTRISVWSQGSPVDEVWTGLLSSTTAQEITWDGLDASGQRCPTGSYEFRAQAIGVTPSTSGFEVVRLGVCELEANDSPAGDDEFQMVYFRKGGYSLYATPAIHEYVNLAPPGEVSDLDLDDGSPRPTVAVHEKTHKPKLDANGDYEQYNYNYPLAYVMGSSPRLELTFGDEGTTAQGDAMPAGYPVAGLDIRALVSDGSVEVATDPIGAGDKVLVDLSPLPGEVGRTDLELTVRWEFAEAGTDTWSPVPGAQALPLRFYTLLGPPQWKDGASGTAYAGPWVEVAQYVADWKQALALPTHDAASLTEVFVKGFFGQTGGIPEAIEGVVYDCYPMGGDGGATHYFNWGTWDMGLSQLLWGHDNGKFVNCTDNMGAATTMLSMMGVENMRSIRLGSMSLNAIWGIGTPDYTTNLWGGGSHGFSYHHIISTTEGVTVSDTCMQLDEDGTPGSTPGFPGWNHQRVWKGTSGYNQLSCTNKPGRQTEPLPGIF